MSAIEEKEEVQAETIEDAYDIQDPAEGVVEPVEEAPEDVSEDTEEAVEEESSPAEDVIEEGDEEASEEVVEEGETEEVVAPTLDISLISQAVQLGLSDVDIAEYQEDPVGLRRLLTQLERRGVATPETAAVEEEQRESVEDYEARLKAAGHDDDIVAELVQSRKDSEFYRTKLSEIEQQSNQSESQRITDEVDSIMDHMADWGEELGTDAESETEAQAANRGKVFDELTILAKAEAERGRGLSARNISSLVKKAVSNALPAQAKKKINSGKVKAVKKRKGQFIQKPGATTGDANQSAEDIAISNLDRLNPNGKSSVNESDEF